jgi:hypothetical protein
MIEAIIHSLEQAPSSFAALRAMRCSVGEKSSAISNGKLRRNLAIDLLRIAAFRRALPSPGTATRKLAVRCLQAAQPSSPDLSKPILARWPK